MHLMLRPVADTGDEIRFAHSPGASLVMALILVAIAASAWMFGTGTVRVLVTVSAGFTAVAQLLRAVYRYELTLDLRAREWRRRRGFAFAVTSAAGPLSDLDAVVLSQTWVTEGSGSARRTVPIWRVGLEFRGTGWRHAITVGTAADEPAAYALLEEYARRFGVDAADRTGIAETRRPPDALDRTVGDADPLRPNGGHVRTAPAVSADPPAASGIEVTTEGGRRVVRLPVLGHGPVTVLAMLLGVPLAVGGLCAIVAGSGVLGPITLNGERTTGPVPLLLVLGGLFCISGLAFAASGLRRARLREWIRDDGDMLIFGTGRPGKVVSIDALPKATIEEVVVFAPRATGGPGLRILGFPVRRGNDACIRVRTDHATVRLGAHLTDPARTWLRHTILAMAESEALP